MQGIHTENVLHWFLKRCFRIRKDSCLYSILITVRNAIIRVNNYAVLLWCTCLNGLGAFYPLLGEINPTEDLQTVATYGLLRFESWGTDVVIIDTNLHGKVSSVCQIQTTEKISKSTRLQCRLLYPRRVLHSVGCFWHISLWDLNPNLL